MKIENVSKYYDEFVAEQARSGINDRIYQLYRRLLKHGLKPRSRVLELGCGIGTLTYLLCRHLQKGKVESVDLSPASIRFAQEHIPYNNVVFHSADIVHFQPAQGQFDFITLFDVIEHIPLSEHDALFGNVSSIANDSTKILINIPNPDYILYDQVHHPEALQVVDQPIPLPILAHTLEKNGLSIQHFETYSVWVENDYQFLLVTKKQPFKETLLQTKQCKLRKALRKVQRMAVSALYPYPPR